MDDERRYPTEEQDDVARLVRLAGKRPEVPHERAARVRAAARETWQRQVRQRTRRRRTWAVAAVAAAALVVLALTLRTGPGDGLPTAPSAATLTVEVLDGPAWSRADGDTGVQRRTSLRVGDTIPAGAAIGTTDQGRLALRLSTGHSVRLDRGTTVRLLDGGALALDGGTLYMDSDTVPSGTDPIDVRTPLGLVREVGTRFEVRLDERSLRVRLRAGAVVVERDRQSHRVEAGHELLAGADGEVVRQAISVHGPEWQWLMDIAPMPELEGRTALAFLEWVARERGWTLAFADETAARAAGRTVLGGAASELTLEDALDAVLPTCRMTHRVDDGVLLIALEPAA